MQTQNRERERSAYAHKYAIHFDILPEISYLNQDLTIIVADLLPLFHDFPADVWIAERRVDEGLDFCRVIFTVSAESPESIKSFGNWFQAIFRESPVTEVLERILTHALDDSNDLEVILSDWTRLAN